LKRSPKSNGMLPRLSRQDETTALVHRVPSPLSAAQTDLRGRCESSGCPRGVPTAQSNFRCRRRGYRLEVSRGLNPRFRVGGRVRPLLRSVDVPSGLTSDNLSVGITLFGRPCSEPALLKLAYANEQATHHHAPPKTKTTPRGLLRGLQIVG
jgi:hypothetical protein